MWIQTPSNSCPATGKECYNCLGTGHYAVLCRHPRYTKTVITGPSAGPAKEDPAATDKEVAPLADTGSSTTEAPIAVLSTHTDHLTAQEDTGKAPHQNFTRSVTLHPVHTQAKKVNSPHTTLQMITKQDSKPIPVKGQPGTNVNTIPLSKYRKLFPVHFTMAGNVKQKSLQPTRHTWTVHGNTPQQFLGFFIADIYHKTQPEILPVRFYVFKDTTSPKILLLYAASERLGIVKFQIPNEGLSTALDTIS